MPARKNRKKPSARRGSGRRLAESYAAVVEGVSYGTRGRGAVAGTDKRWTLRAGKRHARKHYELTTTVTLRATDHNGPIIERVRMDGSPSGAVRWHQTFET